jgi:hypothetical protein
MSAGPGFPIELRVIILDEPAPAFPERVSAESLTPQYRASASWSPGGTGHVDGTRSYVVALEVRSIIPRQT